jgi:16S rRNA (guanine966-N2)-methyltransferase
MRIVAGKHRRRMLFVPEDKDIRPTSDKVRGAVFNILNARGLVVNEVVIDAFCGTGALGLEALSQGASYCTFFDKSKKSVRLCEKNILAFNEQKQSELRLADVTTLGKCPEDRQPARLVFIDPPYHQDLVTPAIESLIEERWVDNQVWFLIETAKDEMISCPSILVELEKTYGDTKITLARLK